MDKVHSYLSDWTIKLVKNQDVLTKKIDGVEKMIWTFMLNIREEWKNFLL